MDVNQVVDVVKEKAGEVKVIAGEAKKKVESVDWEQVKDKASEEIKSLDMGVLYTKAQDAAAKIDVQGIKQKVTDFADSPKMDKVKGALRTVKDFAGFVPNYAQSVPNMVKEALGLDKKD